MNAYIYKAALLCATCGTKTRARIEEAGDCPAYPGLEHTYDSDDYPKGPYPDGGGEADKAQVCDRCGCRLGNPIIGDPDPPQARASA